MALKTLMLLAMAQYTLVEARDVLSKNTNPIRKVLGMLKDMQNELVKEVDSEKDLYEKAMCACSTGEAELTKVIDHSNSETSRLTAEVASQTAAKSRLESQLKAHGADKASTEKGLGESAAIRSREHEKFAQSDKMLKFTLGQLDAAIPMIENSASAASFVQAMDKRSQDSAPNLRRIVSVTTYLSAEQKDQVLGFLQGGEEAGAPSAGSQQIIGVLKVMHDEMSKDSKAMTTDENNAAAAFSEMRTSQLKHLGNVVKTIFDKEKQVGELTLSLSQDNDALDDAQTELNDGTRYLQSLKTQCANKANDRDLRQKSRTGEIAAISEAIKILSGDEQMDTFSKVLKPALAQMPNYGAFLQARGVTKKALPHVQNLMQRTKPAQALLLSQIRRPAGDVAEHASQATKVVGFMIDNMVEVLHSDDVNDEHKKEYCYNETTSFAQLQEDKEMHHDGLEKRIAVLTSEINQLIEDIKALVEERNSIDQQVAEASTQRSKEHDEFAAGYREMDIAKQLIDKAANRLQAFYNPSMFAQAPPTGALTQTAYFMGPPGQEEAEVAPVQSAEAGDDANFGAALVQLASVRGTASNKVAPVELPDTPKTYEKKESGGVLGLLAQMKEDLSVDTRQAEGEEKHAQADYTRVMHDAKVSREDNVKAQNDKEATKADTEEKRLMAKQDLVRTAEEIFQIKQYLSRLHIECDFLMRNFESRHESRVDEEMGLESAETIVTGGDPPTYPGTVKVFKEETAKSHVDEHFPDPAMPTEQASAEQAAEQ